MFVQNKVVLVFVSTGTRPLELGALIGSLSVFWKQIVAVLFPFFMFLAFFIRRRSVRDFHNACLGKQWLFQV